MTQAAQLINRMHWRTRSAATDWPRVGSPQSMTKTDIETQFRSVLDQIGVPDRFGIAVSGGGDSMALLAMAARAGLKPSVVTVDHGLRPEAGEEAELVARFCAQFSLVHTVLRIDALSSGPNLAARARAARYDALASWASKQRLGTILLGHTRDDQAETVLLRLARGSGADGLAAMSPVREWASIEWVRPLLNIEREDLRQWLRAQGIAWADDPTNEDTSYDRVKIRQVLDDLEALGLTRSRLANTARTMARQSVVLQAAGDDLMSRCMRRGDLGAIHLAREPLVAALPDTGLRVLAKVLQIIASAAYRPRLTTLETAMELIASADFRGTSLAGCVIVPNGDEIVVCREPAAVSVVPAKTGSQTWDRRWTITVPEEADFWIAPLGKQALAHATACIRKLGVQTPNAWMTSVPAARLAVPALFKTADSAPEALLAVPMAGLCLDRSVENVTITPPDTAHLRHHGPK